MDQVPLKGSDVMIVTSLMQTPTSNPDAMIGEFCVNTGELFLETSYCLSENFGHFVIMRIFSLL